VSLSSGPLYLCLDQGGHASRAAVFDSTGNMQALAFRDIETFRAGDHVEHDPQELLTSLRQVAAEALAEGKPRDGQNIVAGLATQRSSIVCWDRFTGEPLSQVISWQDRRAAGWLAQYSAHEAKIHGITGLRLSPHYGVSKLRWCLDNLPEVSAAQVAGRLMFGPLASWLSGQLCGQSAWYADPANASRTLLWSRQQLDWSDELLQMFGIQRDCLPQSVTNEYAWGVLAATENKIPLRVVTGDQSAALFAFGRPQPENLYVNLGTGAFLQRPMTSPEFEPERLLASVVFQSDTDVISVLEGTVNGAGSAINAFVEDSGLDMTYVMAHSDEWLAAGESLPLYLNAFSGLGSPWWLADMESRFIGAGTAEQKCAAVLESIAFLITVNFTEIDCIAGQAEQMVITGGLGSVNSLLQRLADLNGVQVVRAETTEATARGLAYLLAGLPLEWPDVQTELIFKPQISSQLKRQYAAWCDVMPAIPQGKKT
jgi:glycerol kinase